MIIKLVGVSMAELESALRYSGLYVQVDHANPDYAEIKSIPISILHDDVRVMDRVKDKFDAEWSAYTERVDKPRFNLSKSEDK